MKTLFNLLLFIFTSNLIIAQAPEIEWQNTIGGNDWDYLFSIQQTTDGGYILGGFSPSSSSGDKTEASLGSYDYWVIKLNSTGAIEWQNTIGGSDGDFLISIQQTTDGGYILGGYSDSGISGDKTEASLGFTDYWVVKLNSVGAIEWQNTIGGSNSDYLYSIQQTVDGGYILGGWSDSDISGDKTEASLESNDYWVVKLNSSGAIEWQNTIGGSSDDILQSIRQTSDGGYILGGYSWSGISGDKTEANMQPSYNDYWVIKLDNTGAIEWQNTIGGNNSEYLYSVQQTADGGYVLGGVSYSGISGDKTEASLGGPDYWVVKLNSAGAIEWQNTIGGSSGDYLHSIDQTDDGGYILGGYSESSISGDKTEANMGLYYTSDYWVVKLDNTGAIEWQNTIGGSSWDYLYSVQQTADGGYILGGYSDSDISGDKTENSWSWGIDYWVIKLEPEGTPECAIPSSLTSFPFTTQAGLEWAEVDGAVKYRVRYKLVGAAVWEYDYASDGKHYVILNGLTCNTEYEWGVTTICAEDGSNSSEYSASSFFTTAGCRLGDENQNVSLNIYPNPNTGEFTIQLSGINTEEITFIRIKNMLGEDVYSVEVNSDEINHSINLGNAVAEGMYLVEAHTGNKVITKQVIIQR